MCMALSCYGICMLCQSDLMQYSWPAGTVDCVIHVCYVVVSPDSRPRDEFFSGDNFLSDRDIESYQLPLSGLLLPAFPSFILLPYAHCNLYRTFIAFTLMAGQQSSCPASKNLTQVVNKGFLW